MAPGTTDMELLLDHLVQTTRLSRGEAARVVAEVLAFHAESAAAFVVRRHAELRAAGWANPAIFEQIARELPQRRFPAPEWTGRQIRRRIYG